MGSIDRRGFSLVEMLVVIATIAVLAAMLFPILQAAQGKARDATCASNIHEMSLAVQMYAQDHDGVFPVSYVARKTGPYYSWRQTVQPYVRNTDIFMCPSSVTKGPKAAELPPWLRHGYAMNGWLSAPNLLSIGGGAGRPVSESAVGEPSKTILLSDAGYSNCPVALDLDHYEWLGMQEQPLPSQRHTGRTATFCFVDGHVKRMTEVQTREPELLWDP